MFRIRFWPITAKPIRAMSAFGSICLRERSRGNLVYNMGHVAHQTTMRAMDRVLERIMRTIERRGLLKAGNSLHHGLLQPNCRIGVAVSGGADSVCLLHALLELRLQLHVLHLNHGLRGEESRLDAEFVRQL